MRWPRARMPRRPSTNVSPVTGTATALRPLAFGEVLDVAIKICTRHWRVLVPITLVMWLPLAFVLQVIGIASQPASGDSGLGGSSFGEPGTTTDAADVRAVLGATAVGVLIVLVGTLIVSGALFRAIGEGYLGAHPTISSSFGFAARRAHSLLWVTVIASVGMVVGLVLCVVPGIWFYAASALAVPVLLTERLTGIRAVRRSLGLVKGSWWRVFGLLIVAQLFVSVVQGAALGLLDTVIQGGGDAVELVGGTIIQAAAYGVTLPFATAVTAVIYFDRRVRLEGFDLEVLAVALEGRVGLDAVPPAPTAPALPSAAGQDWGGEPPYTPPPPDAGADHEAGPDEGKRPPDDG